MKAIILKIRIWWQGEYIEPTLAQVLDEEPEGEEFKRPRLARICFTIKEYCIKEYKWIVGVIMAVLMLIVAYLKL